MDHVHRPVFLKLQLDHRGSDTSADDRQRSFRYMAAERGTHRLQLDDLGIDEIQVMSGNPLYVSARAVLVRVVRVQGDKDTAILDGEAERSGPPD